jgi:hypothetical protein
MSSNIPPTAYGNLGYKGAYPSALGFGEGFALPALQGESLMSRFSPGSERAPTVPPIMDPYAGKLRRRFEIPDTTRVVNLGEMILFTMQSDNEQYMTRDVLPLVDWGWDTRVFEWGVWDFPQMPVPPTPETAPPRFLHSSKLTESTTLIRFAIGQHMSAEYMHTPMGKTNQILNLQQMAYSVQECLNNLATAAIQNAQYQLRARMEHIGSYKVEDVEKALENAARRFCKPQKEERGFQILYEEIQKEMALYGGKADSAILTSKLDALVLSSPEYTEYYRAGPAGPRTVNDTKRSFLSNGVAVYYSKTFPNRFGLDFGPWGSLSQIGDYFSSRELKSVRNGSREYLEGYISDIRSITVYTQETDAFHTIRPEEMLAQCHIFHDDGSLRSIYEPPGGRGAGGGGGNFRGPDVPGDFLTLIDDDPYDPPSFSEAFSGGRGPSASGRLVGNPPLEVFGQLRERHFTNRDVLETGAMIGSRIARLLGLSPSELSRRVSEGLRLYASMCKREVDLDFVTLVLNSHIKNAYRRAWPSLGNLELPNAARGNPENAYFWPDITGVSQEEMYRRVRAAVLDRDAATGRPYFFDGRSDSSCFPLPADEDAATIGGKGRRYNNLTGYASYPGFKAMANAYASGNAGESGLYNEADLKTAAEFVDALDRLGDAALKVLPGCHCLLGTSRRRSPGEIIGEQLMNLVGLRLAVNVKKANLFLLSTEAANRRANRNVAAPNAATYMGFPIDDFVKADAERVPRLLFAEAYEDTMKACFTRYYHEGNLGESNVLARFSREVLGRLRAISDSDFASLIASVDAKHLQNYPYVIKAKDDLARLLSAWVDPQMRSQATSASSKGLAPIAPTSTGGDTGPMVIVETPPVASKSVTSTGLIDGPPALVGIAACYAAINEQNTSLGISSPVANRTFLPLFGPLRLQLYARVLEAAVIAAITLKSNEAFVSALMILNLLVTPSAKGVEYRYPNASGKGAASTAPTEELALFTAASSGGGLTALNAPPADLASKTPENLFAAANYHRLRAQTADYLRNKYGMSDVKGPNLRLAFGAALDEIFRGSRSEVRGELEKVKASVEEASEREREFKEAIDAAQADTSVRGISLPFLEFFFGTTARARLEFPAAENGATVSFRSILRTLMFPTVDATTRKVTRTDRLAAVSGNALEDTARGFYTEPTQAGIGPRLGRTAKAPKAPKGSGRGWRTVPSGFGRPLRDGGDPSSSDEEGGDDGDFGGGGGGGRPEDPDDPTTGADFALTNLFVSADQLEDLFSKNGPSASRGLYDVRVVNPRDPSGYVSLSAQPQLLERANEVQDLLSRGASVRSALNDGGFAFTRGVEWVDVPLLTAEQRLKYTFFGPNAAEALPGRVGPVAGARLKGRYTGDFTRRCWDLDELHVDPLDKYAAVLWMCTPFTQRSCLSLVNNNIRLPVNFLVFRPHSNYLMDSGAFLSTGINNLGFTAIAGKDYAAGFAAMTKEVNTNLSFWANAVVTYPQNVAIVRNLISSGYGPGGGVGWYSPDTYAPNKLGSHLKPTAPSPSLMCVAIPFTEETTRDYVCISGKLQHLEEVGHGGSLSVMGDRLGLHYSTANRYNGIWNWRDPPDSGYMDTVGASGYPLYNKVCWQGLTLYMTPTHNNPAGTFTHATLNKGPWGANQGPGCQAIYAGEPKPLPVFDYSGRYHVVSS